MKRRRMNRGFYGCIAVMNIMVGVAFAALTLPELEPVAAMTVPVNAKPAVPVSVPAVVGMPVRIEIPNLGVNLAVAPGSYDPSRGEWTLSDVQALHADSSMPVNDVNGTTLIYAHALPGLFASLPALESDMVAYITTDTSRVFSYRFTSHTEVSPTDTSVFTAEGPPTLVLQTCSGVWDTHRALYRFAFIEERAA